MQAECNRIHSELSRRRLSYAKIMYFSGNSKSVAFFQRVAEKEYRLKQNIGTVTPRNISSTIVQQTSPL